jgi:predicted nuclease with TOPRIM domain
MTLPPESDEQKVEAQHICRPVIHSYISQGSYAAELQNKIVELEDTIADMNQEKEDILRQLRYHAGDTETLKQELRLKEELVSQLEQEFTSLEELVAHLQQVRS